MIGILEMHRNSGHIALVYGDTRISYADLWSVTTNCSRMLAEAGVYNENVGVLGGNTIAYVVGMFAVAAATNAFVPLSHQATLSELSSEIVYSDLNHIICDQANWEMAAELHKLTNVAVWMIGPGLVVRPMLPSRCRRVRASSGFCALVHTSGSTNEPKRVMLTEANLLTSIQSTIQVINSLAREKVLISLPVHFVTAFSAQLLQTLYLGGTVVLYDRSLFSAKRLFDIVETEEITSFSGVPANFLVLSQYRFLGQYSRKSVLRVCVSGSPINGDLLTEIETLFPKAAVFHMYGLTECAPRVSCLAPSERPAKLNSVGRPVPSVTVEIIGPAEEVLGPGEVGEIRVRGANVAMGYYRRPEQTTESFRELGFHTGDLGYLDGEGFLFLKGRLKNIIISGGVNIYPDEIESVMRTMPGIHDVAVTSAPDSILGEVPVAIVVGDPQIQYSDLRDFLKDRLSGYKHPRAISFVSELPRTSRGKLRLADVKTLAATFSRD